MYIGQRALGVLVGLEGGCGFHPVLQDAFEDLPIEICLGLEVVVNVGLRQPRFAGDALRGRASESVQGERLLSGTQDASLIGLADIELSRWR
jgi:hypothetical protein